MTIKEMKEVLSQFDAKMHVFVYVHNEEGDYYWSLTEDDIYTASDADEAPSWVVIGKNKRKGGTKCQKK